MVGRSILFWGPAFFQLQAVNLRMIRMFHEPCTKESLTFFGVGAMFDSGVRQWGCRNPNRKGIPDGLLTRRDAKFQIYKPCKRMSFQTSKDMGCHWISNHSNQKNINVRSSSLAGHLPRFGTIWMMPFRHLCAVRGLSKVFFGEGLTKGMEKHGKSSWRDLKMWL